MLDDRLKITEATLSELRSMHARSSTPEEMIWFLFRAGVPKAGALVALRQARVMPSADTKAAVHFHEAYASRRESDNAFYEDVLRTVEKLELDEHIAAA